MSTLVETSHAQFLSVLEELRVSCQVQRRPGLPMIQFPWKGEWLRSGVQEHVKRVDKDKIERLVGELPRYTKIVVLFKRIGDEYMIPKTDPAMLALQLLC